MLFSRLFTLSVFFFNDPAPPEIYTLSLHDALPICRALGEQQRGLSRSVGIGDGIPAGDLDRRASAKVHGGDLRIELDQHHVWQESEILPGHVDLALRREETGFLVANREETAAVHRHVEHAVSAAQCLAELGMARNTHSNPGQSGAVAGQYLPSQHRSTPEL